MFRRSLMFLALVATVAARIPYYLCKEGYPALTSFDIPACTSLPCDIHIGDKITMNIGIYVKRAVAELPVRVTIFDNEGFVDIPMPCGDACHAIKNGCPKKAGDYLISLPVQIKGFKPDTKATVRVQIKDDLSDVVACGAITATFK